MSEFIWPLVVVLISVAFFLIFRTPLDELIKRIKGVSNEGINTWGDPARGASLNSDTANQLATLREAHLEETKRIADRYEDRETKTIEPLKRLTEHQSKQIADIVSRIDTIENNRVISRMLAAPPLKSDPKE